MYVGLVKILNTSHLSPLMILSHRSFVSRKYVNLVNCFKTSYLIIPSSSSISSLYVNLVNCLKISHLIIPSHPLKGVREPGQLFIWVLLVWLPRSIPFIRHQFVRELGQLFEGLLSDHPNPTHPPPERTWTCQLCEHLSTNHPIPSSSVSSSYVNLVNCLNTCHLIISFHPSPVCTWTWSTELFKYLSSDHPFPSHPLHLSSACM